MLEQGAAAVELLDAVVARIGDPMLPSEIAMPAGSLSLPASLPAPPNSEVASPSLTLNFSTRLLPVSATHRLPLESNVIAAGALTSPFSLQLSRAR